MNEIILPAAALLGLLIVATAIVLIYNRLVRGRILVQEAFSGIDVQLKRRHNLVPNLLKTVEGYANFERRVLTEVTQSRARAMGDQTIADKERDENALSDSLKNLFAVAEAYPDLKANAGFLGLQQELSEIEDVIQKARRYYNGTVREYNTRVQSFPSNITASVFHFGPAPFFELDSLEARAVPQIELNSPKQE
jgi:LemA protein